MFNVLSHCSHVGCLCLVRQHSLPALSLCLSGQLLSWLGPHLSAVLGENLSSHARLRPHSLRLLLLLRTAALLLLASSTRNSSRFLKGFPLVVLPVTTSGSEGFAHISSVKARVQMTVEVKNTGSMVQPGYAESVSHVSMIESQDDFNGWLGNLFECPPLLQITVLLYHIFRREYCRQCQ